MTPPAFSQLRFYANKKGRGLAKALGVKQYAYDSGNVEREKDPSGVIVELSPEAFSRFDARAKADLLSYAACGDCPRARFLAFLQNTQNTIFRDSIQNIEIKGEAVKPSFLYEFCKTKVSQ